MPTVAVSTGQAVLIGVAAGLFVAAVGFGILSGRRRRRQAQLDIPAAMRPGPSDPDLEKPVLEKMLAFGTLFTVIMALWMPIVFLRDPGQNKSDTQETVDKSVERGQQTTEAGSEENPLGFNCERCHGTGLSGGHNVFNDALVTVPDLTTVCGGAAYGHPLITNLQDVVNTIARGRQGTDMPSWSVRFAGAMTDQQINDVVNYILSIQTVPDDQNVCLGTVASPTPSASGSGSPTPSASGSGSATPSASPTG